MSIIDGTQGGTSSSASLTVIEQEWSA